LGLTLPRLGSPPGTTRGERRLLTPGVRDAPALRTGDTSAHSEDRIVNPLSQLKHLLRRGVGHSDAPDIAFGILPLEVTREQLSYWEDHPNAVGVARHTEETARAAAGHPTPPIAAAMFAIRLPFDLPVPDGAAFGLRRSQDPDVPTWVMLSVQRVKVEPAAALLAPYESGLAVLMGEVRPKLKKGFSGQTWILASTLNVGFDDEPFAALSQLSGGGLSIGFERCLRAINMVCDASRLVADDLYSRPLSKESLDPTLTWFDVDIQSNELGSRHEMRLHSRVYNPRLVAQDPEAIHVRLSQDVSRRLEAESAALSHPLHMARLLASQAETQRWYGERSAAVITLQAAVETLATGLYRLLLVDEGLDSAEIDEQAKASFRSVLRGRLPDILGGRWTGPGAAPEQYWTDVYRVRNALVHAGKEPPWWHLNEGAKTHQALIGFIDQRLLVAWRHHPRTLVAWCEQWAGGSLALPRAAQPIADALLQEAQAYWLPRDLGGANQNAARSVAEGRLVLDREPSSSPGPAALSPAAMVRELSLYVACASVVHLCDCAMRNRSR